MLSKADNGRMIETPVGEALAIELPELATAGFEWALVAIPPGLVVSIERPHAIVGGVGSTARTRIVVHAERALTGTLVFVHRQPWNPSATDERFELTIVAR